MGVVDLERVEPAQNSAYVALGLVLTAGLVNYVDRVTLSVTGPVIAGELHLRPSQMGVLLSAFLWTYGLAQAPVGAIIDRPGRGGCWAGRWSSGQRPRARPASRSGCRS